MLSAAPFARYAAAHTPKSLGASEHAVAMGSLPHLTRRSRLFCSILCIEMMHFGYNLLPAVASGASPRNNIYVIHRSAVVLVLWSTLAPPKHWSMDAEPYFPAEIHDSNRKSLMDGWDASAIRAQGEPRKYIRDD